MNIDKKQSTDKTIFALSGRLDTTTAPQLQEVLIPEFASAKHVVLDFAEVAYVSSAGLRILLMGEKAAKGNGAKQTLVNVSAEIVEIFDITGFTRVLNIEP